MRSVRAGAWLSWAALLACVHDARQAVGEGSSGESEDADATNADDAPSTQGVPDDGTPTTSEPDDGETTPGSTTTPGDTTDAGTSTGAQPACLTHEECGAGMICDGDCRRPLHCAELLSAWPETGNGDHPLDPDGDGTETSFTCDMEYEGGGWTRVLLEDFDASDGAAWSAAVVSSCGNLGQMLGGSGNFAGGTVDRGVEL